MKKSYSIIVCMILVVLIFTLSKNQKTGNDFKSVFEKWDSGTVEPLEKIEIMNSFLDYLIRHPKISNEYILSLSSLFRVYESDNLRIIEYIENPEFYGASARGSYHIVIYNDRVEIFDMNGSMRINKISALDGLYYVYATDYKISNVTGIDIFRAIIDEHNIEFKSIIAIDELSIGFVYSDALYYNNDHIFYKNINTGEVEIQANNEIFVLILEKDGLYHLTKVD